MAEDVQIPEDLPKALFINIEVDEQVARDPEIVKRLVESCPVDIFAREQKGTLRIVEENLDECVLCYLCVDATPEGTVSVVKLYE